MADATGFAILRAVMKLGFAERRKNQCRITHSNACLLFDSRIISFSGVRLCMLMKEPIGLEGGYLVPLKKVW